MNDKNSLNSNSQNMFNLYNLDCRVRKKKRREIKTTFKSRLSRTLSRNKIKIISYNNNNKKKLYFIYYTLDGDQNEKIKKL